MLADRAIASENEVKDNTVGVAEVRVNDSEKLIGIMGDISRRLKKDIKRNNLIISSRETEEEKKRQTSKLFSLMLMRDRLHLAWPQIITVIKIMDKMLLPQKYQTPLARSDAKFAANRYRTANGYGRCTDLLLSSEIWRVCADTPVPSL